MTRSSSLALSITVMSLLIAASALGQKPATNQSQPPQPPQQRRDDTPQKLGVLEVRLPISVKQEKRFVEGLTVNNFEVYEDGKRQKIEKFMAPSMLPLRIGLLIDTSNSVKLKLPFEKDAAEDFSATVTTFRRKDQILVASFDSDVELHQDFTDNLQPLVGAIRKLKAGGYTKLYDGVYRVIEEKMSNLQNDEARRIIVVLSDGEDTASEHTLKETIEMAQRYDVTLFGISTKNFRGITSGQVENADDKELRRLCEETGGQIFLPSEKLELFKAFSQVGKDLRLEYVLFYTPTNQQKSGNKREIKVKLVAADGRPSYKRGYVY
ncbi:MAG TPA: VWA domain-containing protein [Blastocatellia bacterium]|nr:VWA domain-containing protein [Blastocatellia bacterium]